MIHRNAFEHLKPLLDTVSGGHVGPQAKRGARAGHQLHPCPKIHREKTLKPNDFSRVVLNLKGLIHHDQ